MNAAIAIPDVIKLPLAIVGGVFLLVLFVRVALAWWEAGRP